MLDLQPIHQQIVVDVVHQYAPAAKIYAFGSRTHGKAKPYSDLDLLICTPQPLSPLSRASLRMAFEESDLPMRVDWLQWHEAPEYLRSIALSAGAALS